VARLRALSPNQRRPAYIRHVLLLYSRQATGASRPDSIVDARRKLDHVVRACLRSRSVGTARLLAHTRMAGDVVSASKRATLPVRSARTKVGPATQDLVPSSITTPVMNCSIAVAVASSPGMPAVACRDARRQSHLVLRDGFRRHRWLFVHRIRLLTAGSEEEDEHKEGRRAACQKSHFSPTFMAHRSRVARRQETSVRGRHSRRMRESRA
jgi:hypothetical protein